MLWININCPKIGSICGSREEMENHEVGFESFSGIQLLHVSQLLSDGSYSIGGETVKVVDF